MKPARLLRRLTYLAVFVAFVAAPISRAQVQDSAEINNLLSQSKTHARLAVNDAEKLDSYLRSHVSWQTHAMSLESMKEHVNELGRLHMELANARDQGSAWQQDAIDRIEPLLQSMADHLTATINHLNQNVNRVQMPAYLDYVKANYELAQKAAQAIDDYVEYSQVKVRTDRLELKLEVPASSESN